VEDGRVKFIVLIAFLCIFGSVIVYYIDHGTHPETFFGAVFASWLGGLALFIITGIAIFVFSIARPEKDSFDARARILFRRQAGRHIDYIVERIKGILEHYAESTEVTVSTISFHAGENKYRVASKNITQVRSYIDDVETTYVSALGRTNVTLPPPGGESNRLIYLRIDGTPHGLPEPFQAAFERPVNCRVNRNGKWMCPDFFALSVGLSGTRHWLKR
jgi:hypothetical protein